MTDKKVFDIAGLGTIDASNEGRICKIINPSTGKETGIEIEIYGPDSVAAANSLEQTKKQLSENIKNKIDLTADEKEDINIRSLVAITKGWNEFPYNGKKFPFNKRNADKLYRSIPIVRDQVESYQGNRLNFLDGAGKS